MSDNVDLSTIRFAELAAPAVTRAFVAGMRAAGGEARDLVQSYGGSQVIGYLIDLRNPLAAGRAVSRDALAVIYRYLAPERIDATVARSVDAGLLARDGQGAITATDQGRAFLSDLFAMHATALADRWGPAGDQTGVTTHTERVARLNDLVSRLLPAAAATAGPAWAVQAPPYEPAGTTPAVLLLNRLSTLRYHRADAHARAWQAAGLTADQVAGQPQGAQWTPQRQAAEHDTNRRDAAPYAVLSAEERLTLLADLAGLP